MASCTRPPSQNPPCRIPATGSPECTGSSSVIRLSGVMYEDTAASEPRAAQQVAPVEPMPLASATQTADPLKLDLDCAPTEACAHSDEGRKY